MIITTLTHSSTWQLSKTVLACICIGATFILVCYNAVLSHSIALLCALSHLILTLILLIFYIINHYYIARKSKPRATYRMWMLERIFVLASGLLFSLIACLLLVLSGFRLMQPVDVAIDPVLQTGVAILISNMICYFLLSSKQSSAQAYMRYLLRMDSMNAIFVVLVTLMLLKWNVSIIDEILAMLLALTLLKQSYQILTQSLVMMTEGTNEQRQLAAIQERLYCLTAVTDISNIQLWTVIGETMTLSCGLKITPDAHLEAVHQEVVTILKKEYHITNVVIRFIQ